ncbi:PIN/TRAM domain-containing protein [Virgibacillus oceani]|uniref:PIN/TRAM domain-containing protein n=1 Tax=Virgibacillus oceani TaxID=1479511 RepID=UPI00166DA0A1|nr:PIN/TRAM domain-containing protein [Virgibacillus oceani]
MLKRITIIMSGTIGIFLVLDLINGMTNGKVPLWVSYLIGIVVFFITIFWMIGYGISFIRLIEEKLMEVPVTNVLCGSIGLILGLSLAFLITSPLKEMSIGVVNTVFPIFLTLLFGYLGFQVGFKKKNDIINLLPALELNDTKNTKIGVESKKELQRKVKILDTGAILDGRIEEICKTGFLEGTLVIPEFVLEEVQHVADSSEPIKRNRGRKGLDTLNRIQKELELQVEIYEGGFNEIKAVDRFVKLAKLLNGTVVTNDSNLNKVCNLHDVNVLNINDLARAIKPVVFPGEKINVQIIKDGKDDNQGVAYLDDGTMIVVEKGRDYIGDYIDVLVTKLLQTPAGKMIFAKPIIQKG